MASKDKESIFRRRVYEIVALVPKGKVVTYGQVALLVGLPRAAREVGWIAHTGPNDLPWQRVVNRFGGLAKGYPGGQLGHKIELVKDEIVVREDFTVDLQRYQWWPDQITRMKLKLPVEISSDLNQKIPFATERLTEKYRRNK